MHRKKPIVAAVKKKQRIDLLLVERGLAETRTQAQRLLMAGAVFVNGQRIDKAGTRIDPDAAIEVRAQLPYVSRGGIKLAHALDRFGLSPQGLVCLDVGASTGGFTDVLLQRGAKRVYALDVGHGQLHWKLRNDARVVNLERTHLDRLREGILPEAVQAITIDVSFISATRALAAAWPHLLAGGWCVVLIKPQFELAPRFLRKGVVRDAAAREQAIAKVRTFAQALTGASVLGVVPSPITGPKGNQEFLLALRRV